MRQVHFSILATLGVLVAFFLVHAGSATHLNIADETHLTDTKASSCMEDEVDVVLDANSFTTVSNIDDSCIDESIAVTFIYANSTNTVSVDGVVSGSEWYDSSTAVPSSANITGTLVHINGWSIPSNWTVLNLPDGFSVQYTWTQNSATQFCVNVNVSTSSTTPIPWNVSFNTSNYPLNGDTNLSHYQVSYGYTLQSAGSGSIEVTGRTDVNSNNTVVNGTPKTFQLCNYNAPRPAIPAQGSGITVSSSVGALPSASYYPCQTVNVTSTGSDFYVGWAVEYDSKPLASRYIPGGGKVVPPSNAYTFTPLGNGVYRITSTDWNTSSVRPANPVNFNVCWGS